MLIVIDINNNVNVILTLLCTGQVSKCRSSPPFSNLESAVITVAQNVVWGPESLSHFPNLTHLDSSRARPEI